MWDASSPRFSVSAYPTPDTAVANRVVTSPMSALSLAKPPFLDARLVEIQRAVNLDLDAVNPGGRRTHLPDDLTALVRIVHRDAVFEISQCLDDAGGHLAPRASTVQVRYDETRCRTGPSGVMVFPIDFIEDHLHTHHILAAIVSIAVPNNASYPIRAANSTAMGINTRYSEISPRKDPPAATSTITVGATM